MKCKESSIIIFLSLVVLLLNINCSNQPLSNNNTIQNEASSEQTGLKLHLSRNAEGFSINLENSAAKSGTYVVFISNSSLDKAIKLGGATQNSFDESNKSTGYYDTEPEPQSEEILAEIDILVTLLSSLIQGTVILEGFKLPGKILGIQPITEPSQLPLIAFAIGENYINAVTDNNKNSGPYIELLKIMQNEEGILLVSGKGYNIKINTIEKPENIGIEVTIDYIHSRLLPPLSTLHWPNKLIHYLNQYKFGRIPIFSNKTVSASLPPFEECAYDVSGTWSGVLKQDPGGTHPEFNFEMVLTQTGTNVSGTSRIEVKNKPQYYGVMTLKGTVVGDIFSFQEDRITENHPEPGTYWCIKKGDLTISSSGNTKLLSGNWTAPTCAPGQISLTLQP